MRRIILAALLAASASVAIAAPTPKEQLLVPPAGARHYTISSTAGKHGDIWSWTTARRTQRLPHVDVAARLDHRGSMRLVTLGADGRPDRDRDSRIYRPAAMPTEDFNVDSNGVAHWKTVGRFRLALPSAAKRYSTYGGPWLAGEQDIDALVAAGDKGIDLLPSGHASDQHRPGDADRRSARPQDRQARLHQGLRLLALRRSGSTATTIISAMPASSRCCPRAMKAPAPKLKAIQDDGDRGDGPRRRAPIPAIRPTRRRPWSTMSDVRFGRRALSCRPRGAGRRRQGRRDRRRRDRSRRRPAPRSSTAAARRSLPGLWDSHQHIGGDDWNLLQNVATGMTNYRSPGTMIDDALSIYKRRAAGDLLAPDGKISVIVDRKDPLAAQGALTVDVRRGNDRRGRQDQGRRACGASNSTRR